jgi:hypothetical protein
MADDSLVAYGNMVEWWWEENQSIENSWTCACVNCQYGAYSPGSVGANGCQQAGPGFVGNADACCQHNFGNVNMMAVDYGLETNIGPDVLDIYKCVDTRMKKDEEN